MRFVALSAIALIAWATTVFPQDSSQKEDILSARKNDKLADTRRKHCNRLGFPAALSVGSCFSVYPLETITWGRGFANGLAKVSIRGKVGFIDRFGRLVIPAKLKDAGMFSEGLAPFEDPGGKWGYIDSKGAVVIAPKFDWAISFKEGLGLVQVGKTWGYINRKGDLVIKPQFEEAGSFSEGVAVVGWYDKDIEWKAATPRKGRWVRRFINKDGQWAIDKSYDGITRGFDGGMAIVSISLGYSEKYQAMISEDVIIDRLGRELWKLGSPSTNWFSDDAIIIEVSRPANGWSQYNFKDRSGKFLCSSSFENPGGFSEGLSTVRVKNTYGFINKKCEFEIPLQYSSADSFSEGLAWVKDLSGRKGFIDRSGKWVLETTFGWVGSFSDGAALVLDGDKAGYINRNGKVIWKPTK